MAAEQPEERMFGTDGVRGEFGSKHINHDAFYDLASAVGEYEVDANDSQLFIVGGDTRASTPELLEGVTDALTSRGIEYVNVGIAPTPAIAWLAKEMDASAIAITASHNPYYDNGFKAFSRGGDKMFGPPLQIIEDRYHRLRSERQDRTRNGLTFNGEGLVESRYIQHLAEHFEEGRLDGKIMAIDAAHGAAFRLAPLLFSRLGARVVPFATKLDRPINENSGAASLGGFSDFLEHKASLLGNREFIGGFAFDGDADRIMGIDEQVREVDGNYWLSRLAIGQPAIVGTVYTNLGLRRHLESQGIGFIECANGDINVTRTLVEHGLQIGGEITGHHVDRKHLSSGDGLYMAAHMATRLADNGESLAGVRDEFDLWPKKMIGLKIGESVDAGAALASDVVTEELAAIEEEFGDSQRTIIRKSGTQPLIRVYAEAEAPGAAQSIADRLGRVVAQATVT